MNANLNYRYWKRVDFSNPEQCRGLFRDKFFASPLERYWLGSWHNASEIAWSVWQDPEYVEIAETEALALMPVLLDLHQKKAMHDAHQAQELLRAKEAALKATQPEEPQPLSALLTAAIAMHELFLNLKTAGFSEEQALKLVSEMVRKPEKLNEQL